uniref:Conidiation-related protein n=1 Tax=Puccinia striiformis f. sp. tritici TaxID=168172 RepID=D0EM89_9BASI|nr:conidiation-related protein [Puccinia striiformis f. sp. tritici]
MANPANVAAGLKGTLNNPIGQQNVSDEAKHHAEHRLETQGYKSASAHDSGHTKDPENVKRGIKAALHNPNVSEQKKDELRHKLDEQF